MQLRYLINWFLGFNSIILISSCFNRDYSLLSTISIAHFKIDSVIMFVKEHRILIWNYVCYVILTITQECLRLNKVFAKTLSKWRLKTKMNYLVSPLLLDFF